MPEQKLRHIVLFSFKDTAKSEQVEASEQAFCALPDAIPGISDFEWGTNVSPEGLAQGFTHCFLVTFRSEADRDAYLPHTAHQAFVSKIKPILGKVLVVDFWGSSDTD